MYVFIKKMSGREKSVLKISPPRNMGFIYHFICVVGLFFSATEGQIDGDMPPDIGPPMIGPPFIGPPDIAPPNIGPPFIRPPIFGADPCRQRHAVTGPCRVNVERYTYNPNTRRCERFTYGGCDGNSNNFETERECRDRCERNGGGGGLLPGLPPFIRPPFLPDGRCREPMAVRGLCNNDRLRYTFNQRTRRCESFTYGGCLGNRNNFITERECRQQCERDGGGVPPIRPPILPGGRCRQPMADRGPCNRNTIRYTYNQLNRRCERFTYGGCFGNRNNFLTEAECRQECEQDGIGIPPTRPPIIPDSRCMAPMAVRGPCNENLERYTYNQVTRRCESFTFGGCLGNRNNFLTESECRQQCERDGGGPGPRPPTDPSGRCRERHAVRGPCRMNVERYTYNPNTRQCERFTYGGCRGTRNNFLSLTECEDQCERRGGPDPRPPTDPSGRCRERHAVRGPCRRNVERYTYNPNTRQCERFTYGGCRGTRNNFRSLTECEDQCERRGGGGGRDPCQQQSGVVGPCRAAFPRFTYNRQTGNCEQFIYGGCQGNDNNFMSLQECQRRCVDGGSADPCRERYAVSGICLAYMPMYTYNYDTRRCERFIYGGCGGNRNRFSTMRECRVQCANRGTRGVCLLPMRRGRCRRNERRFYYNTATDRCEEFTYGGCLGNRNNFETMADCQQACESRRTTIISPP